LRRYITVMITSETNPEVGALQFDADVFISTKKVRRCRLTLSNPR
jgi:hypothetical protein